MQPVIWRPTLFSRVMLVVFACGMIGFAVWIITVSADEGDLLAGLLLGIGTGLLPAALALRALRLKIVADHDRLVLVSLLSTRQVPWVEVAGAQAGYGGITVVLRDGTTHLAGAVQKSNAASWFGWRTRADEVVDCIAERSGG